MKTNYPKAICSHYTEEYNKKRNFNPSMNKVFIPQTTYDTKFTR